MKITKQKLEKIYRRYNHRRFVHPDPLEFLYKYPEEKDRELVGLIASSLAYGRVDQILKSVSCILYKMGPSPRDYIMGCGYEDMKKEFELFCHRFTKGEELSRVLFSVKKILKEYGTIRECFSSNFKKADSMPDALTLFIHEIYSYMGDHNKNTLLPDPSKGSACKRLNLFLRWMVRSDEVDPGTWSEIPKSSLIIPLDIHMHRISQITSLTNRKSPEMRTALEITEKFLIISPNDPVKYDFALTRIGILNKEIKKEILI